MGRKKSPQHLAPWVHGLVLQGHAQVMGLLENLFRWASLRLLTSGNDAVGLKAVGCCSWSKLQLDVVLLDWRQQGDVVVGQDCSWMWCSFDYDWVCCSRCIWSWLHSYSCDRNWSIQKQYKHNFQCYGWKGYHCWFSGLKLLLLKVWILGLLLE